MVSIAVMVFISGTMPAQVEETCNMLSQRYRNLLHDGLTSPEDLARNYTSLVINYKPRLEMNYDIQREDNKGPPVPWKGAGIGRSKRIHTETDPQVYILLILRKRIGTAQHCNFAGY